ncbi:restriction endonuclease subunit S [Rothia nasimurium]|uniref:restriction endonuclease subunit S n=1 Tax=Rothia nasimurium TaxID=85336 RepID=UPI001EFF715C|nr:restriction endonuclease subunit S [Rothia nasimurium]
MKIPDWLHNIPSHWEIRKASHILDISVGGTPPTSNPEFFDGDIPWVTIADMNSDEIFGSSHYLSESGLRHSNIRWSEPGDLLYSFKLSIGKTAFVKKPVVTNEAIATIHKSSKIHLPFARYVLPLAFEQAAGTNIYGAKILNQQQLKAALIPIPPLEEQKKIADELDRELAEIDKLIADAQRLESLEQELIVAERDWAFEQSETSVPLKYIAKFITSGSRGWGDYVGDIGSPFMRITNLRRNSIEPDLSNLLYVDTAKLPNDEGKRSQLQIGDILISITADLGSVTVVDERIAGGYVSQHLALVRINTDKYDPYSVAEAILSSKVKHQIKQKSYGGTKIQLNLEDIKELNIPILRNVKINRNNSRFNLNAETYLNEIKESLLVNRINKQ